MTIQMDYGINADTVEEFRSNFREAEEAGRIDSEGGSEWRGSLAEVTCDKLGVEPTSEGIKWLRDAFWYAQCVGLGEFDEDAFAVIGGA
jgi:hypothetical protein